VRGSSHLPRKHHQEIHEGGLVRLVPRQREFRIVGAFPEIQEVHRPAVARRSLAFEQRVAGRSRRVIQNPGRRLKTKATQTSGLEAARVDVVHNLGVAAVKQLSPGVSQEELKKDKYVHFSDVPMQDKISPEQAEYNVLNAYFDGTPSPLSSVEPKVLRRLTICKSTQRTSFTRISRSSRYR
jgi:hypothetical protein